MDVPEHIQRAMMELILFMLANGRDVDGGTFIEISQVTCGDNAYGDWRLELKRTKKP